MIPYERVEQALQYLAETDVREAEYKAEVESAKRAMDEIFKTIAAASDGTVLQKEAKAGNSEQYKEAKVRYIESIGNHGAVKNERHRNELIIDVWRSINSARNKGQII